MSRATRIVLLVVGASAALVAGIVAHLAA